VRDSGLDAGATRAATTLASRSPCTHNRQPRRYRLGGSGLPLYADPTLEAWIAENASVATGYPWECYSDEPDTPEPRTQVYLSRTLASRG
jgi:hypothetical protein